MNALRKFALRLFSEVVWRVPGWPQRILLSFSQAERGSYYDMLFAVERTERRDLRRKYLEHALDEGRHAGMFMDRVKALGAGDRVQAVMTDAAHLSTSGVKGQVPLFERMGELEFLAFVYIAESDGAEQFQLYLDRDLPDPDTQAALREITRDERFHKSYSYAALDHYRQRGQDKEVRRALWRVQWNRFKEAWLNSSRHIGTVVGSVWLVLLYALAVAPFRLFGRLDPGGWHAPRKDPRPLAVSARSQG